ncbi:MAG TPA: outer membrane lipoprotein carrier protein LolA [Pseudonocardiaceae bacterium]
MRHRKVMLGATAGAVAGALGLTLLAVPAGAGQAPTLPEVSPEELVQSVLTAEVPALNGTVEVDNALDLPALPGTTGTEALAGNPVRVWTDGQNRHRIALTTGAGERTLVVDGTTFWSWDSAQRKVTKIEHGRVPEQRKHDTAQQDPATVARDLVAAVRQSSSVSVDGTAEVAGRDAYELVLAPAPTERTLLRQVRVAVDAEKRIPLRVTVLANGSADPVLQAGFTELSLGPQDPDLFRFAPPPGATVEEVTPERAHGNTDPRWPGAEARPTVVGDGWDAVLVGRLPQDTGQHPTGRDERGRAGEQDPMALVRQIGTPVSGPWGSGWLISTKVGSALVTADGRVAVGAVPEQVLTEALGSTR